jgi:phosphohistidine phosphatase
MELLLLRHGHAEPLASTDALRPLSERGRLEVASVIKSAMEMIGKLDAVWVSPYLRAQQTWAEARVLLSQAPAPETISEVTPDGEIELFLTRLKSASVRRCLVVTHQPFVGDLITALCGDSAGNLRMDTANLVALKLVHSAAGLSEILWFKQPNVL